MASAFMSELQRLRQFVQFEKEEMEVPVPQIVIVGTQTNGKSSVVEGLVGVPFNYVAGGVATRVPLEFYTYADPTYSEPSWAISFKGKKEGLSTKELACEIEWINKDLASRNSVSFDPVIVEMRWAKTVNLFFTDMPGLQSNAAESRELQRQIENLNRHVVQKLAKQPKNAVLLIVEEATDPVKYASVPQIKRFISECNHDSKEKLAQVLVLNKMDLFIHQAQQDFTVLETFFQYAKSWQDGLLDYGDEGNQVFFTYCPKKEDRKTFIRSDEKLNEHSSFEKLIHDCGSEISVFLSEKGQNEFSKSSAGLFALRSWICDRLTTIIKEKRLDIISSVKQSVLKLQREVEHISNCVRKEWINDHSIPFTNAFVHSMIDIWRGDANYVEGMTLNEEYKSIRSSENCQFDFQNCCRESKKKEFSEVILGCDMKLYGSSQIRRLLSEFVFCLFRVKNDFDENGAVSREKDMIYNWRNALGESGLSLTPWIIIFQKFLKYRYDKETANHLKVFSAALDAIVCSWIDQAFEMTMCAQPEASHIPLDIKEMIQNAFSRRISEFSSKMAREATNFMEAQVLLSEHTIPDFELRQDDTASQRIKFIKQLLQYSSVSSNLDESLCVEEAYEKLDEIVFQRLMSGYISVAHSTTAMFETFFKRPFLNDLQSLLVQDMEDIRKTILSEKSLQSRVENLQNKIYHLEAFMKNIASIHL
jgi:hypothetical protein